jgi:hypothetical protein
MLTIEPNSPLLSLKFALTSGNLGTQDMIKRPNIKKRALMRFSSCLTSMVFLKTGHSLTLYGQQLNVDQMDQPRKTDPVNDS